MADTTLYVWLPRRVRGREVLPPTYREAKPAEVLANPAALALQADLARLRDVLAAERGERGPEGWEYEEGIWRRELDDNDDHEWSIQREEPRWDPSEWAACEYAGGRLQRNLGMYPTALEAMEAADRAAKKEKT